MGFDLYPMDTLAAKKQFVQEAIEKRDPGVLRARSGVAAGYIREQDGKRRSSPVIG